MGITFDGQPVYDARKLYQACVKQGLRTDHWLGKANYFTNPLTKPGSGKILLTRATLDSLNLESGDKFRELVFADGDSEPVRLKKVVMVGHELAVTPGLEGDEATMYVVELSDPRWFHWDRGNPITTSYNLRTDLDGSYVTDTLNAGTPWTWQQIIADLWPADLGAVPTLPFTPHGTPESFWFINDYPLNAINHILIRLCCGLKYDQTLDSYSIVRMGDTDAANAAMSDVLEATYRPVLRYDGYAIAPLLAQFPAVLRVEFRVRKPYTDGSLPYYSVDVPVEGQADVNTAYLVLEDELTAIFDGSSITNTTTLDARADQRAAHWQAKRENHDTAVYREYSGYFDFAPALGCYFAAVGWEDRGRGMLTSIAAGTNADRRVEDWKRRDYTDPVGNDTAMWGAPLIRMGGGNSNNTPCCCCDQPTKPPVGDGGPVPKPGGMTSTMTTVPPSGGLTWTLTTFPGGVLPETLPPSMTDRTVGTQQICQWTYQTGVGYVSSCFDWPGGVRAYPGGGSGETPLGGPAAGSRGLNNFIGQEGRGGLSRGASALLAIYGVDRPGAAGTVLTSNGPTLAPTYQTVSAGTISGTLTVTQPTLGDPVYVFSSTSAGDDPSVTMYQNRTTTTNNTATTIHTLTLADDTTYFIKAHIVGRRTGGSAGTAGDSCAFIVNRVYKRTGGGGATIVSASPDQSLIARNNVAVSANMATSGNDVLIQVTGDTNNNYSWQLVELRVSHISS